MMKEILLMMLPWVVIPPIVLGIWLAVYRRRHPPSQEALEAARVLGDFRWLPSGRAAVVFLFVYDGAYWARRLTAVPGALKAVLLVAPVLVFAWFAYLFLREFRKGDEFERRIQGEAASLALWMFLTWSVGMWVMEEIWPAPRRGTFSAALGFLPLNYAFGLFLAKGRYMPTAKEQG